MVVKLKGRFKVVVLAPCYQVIYGLADIQERTVDVKGVQEMTAFIEGGVQGLKLVDAEQYGSIESVLSRF